MSNNNKFFGILMLLVVAVMATSAVSALPATIDWVKLDGDVVDASGTNYIQAIERGDSYEVKIRVTNDGNVTVEDVQIEAEFKGLHNDNVRDITDTFDIKPGTSYVKTLNLELPDRIDTEYFKLRVYVSDRYGEEVTETYNLKIDAVRNEMRIRDVVFSPAYAVEAGRALLTTVRVRNTGFFDDNDGIKISVSIPELGVSASDYIDELDAEDSTTSEELYMRIPACAASGTYDVVIDVYYDDMDAKVSTTREMMVTKGEMCPGDSDSSDNTEQPKTTITVGSTSKDIAADGFAIYPVTVTNQVGKDRTYIIDVDLGSWASYEVSPSNVLVLDDGASATAYVTVTPNENAAAQEYIFSVSVSSGGEVLKQVPMKAVVTGGSDDDATSGPAWSKVRTALEIGLVVLVVLLVIFGLIVGFNKMKSSGDDEDDDDLSGKTYY